MDTNGLRFYPDQMFLRRLSDDYQIFSTSFDDPEDVYKFDHLLMNIKGRVMFENMSALLHFIDSLDNEVIELKEKASKNCTVYLKFIAGEDSDSPFFTICFHNGLILPELSWLPEFSRLVGFEIE